MPTNPLLTNQSLMGLSQKTQLAQKDKDLLSQKIPGLDEQERMSLLRTLAKIYLLDIEERETIARLKKYWPK